MSSSIYSPTYGLSQPTPSNTSYFGTYGSTLRNNSSLNNYAGNNAVNTSLLGATSALGTSAAYSPYDPYSLSAYRNNLSLGAANYNAYYNSAAWNARVVAAELAAQQQSQLSAAELQEANRVLEAERRLRVGLQQELTRYYNEHSRDRVALEDLRQYAEQAVAQCRQLADRNETLQVALARLAAAQVPVHVPVDRPVYQEVIVEKPIHVPVDRPVYQVVEKRVEVDRPVIVDRPVEVFVPVPTPSPPQTQEYGGVGMQLQEEPNLQELSVKHLVPGSPAARSGLIAIGDKVIGVDVYSVRDRPLAVVADYIRGPVGTTVRLHLRGGPNSKRYGEYFEAVLQRYVEPTGSIVYHGFPQSPTTTNPQQQPWGGGGSVAPFNPLNSYANAGAATSAYRSAAIPPLLSSGTHYAGFPLIESSFGTRPPPSAATVNNPAAGIFGGSSYGSTGGIGGIPLAASLVPMPNTRTSTQAIPAPALVSTGPRVIGERWLGADEGVPTNSGPVNFSA